MKVSLRKSISQRTKFNQYPTSDSEISIANEDSKHLSIQKDFTQAVRNTSLSWPICLYPLFYTILTLFLMYQVQSMNDPQKNPAQAQATLKTLELNLGRAPILDISNQIHTNHLHRHYRECPNDYEVAELGTWKGVNQGCLCKNGNIKSRAYCLTHFASEDCMNVGSLPERSFYYWKGSQLCIKYAKDWIWSADQACPDNYRSCAIGVCIKLSEPCPITDLEYAQPDQFTIEIGGLHFRKIRNNELPLVHFSIVPGRMKHAACLNRNLAPKFQSKKFYPLATQPEKGCDTFGTISKYSKSIDSDFQLNVYDDNSFNDIERLPYFYNYVDSKDTYSLAVINRIFVNQTEQCNKVDAETLKLMRTQGEVIHFFTKYITKTILATGVFFLCSTIFLFLLRNVHYMSLNIKEFSLIQYNIIGAIILSIGCICLGVIYITQADGENGLDGQQIRFRQYQQFNCFEDQGIQLVNLSKLYCVQAVLQVLDFAQQSYSDTEPYVKLGFYGGIIFCLSITILLLIQYKQKNEFFIKPWLEESSIEE